MPGSKASGSAGIPERLSVSDFDAQDHPRTNGAAGQEEGHEPGIAPEHPGGKQHHARHAGERDPPDSTRDAAVNLPVPERRADGGVVEQPAVQSGRRPGKTIGAEDQKGRGRQSWQKNACHAKCE